MKKKILILSVFVLLIGVIILSHNSSKNDVLEVEKPNVIKQENTLSMMLETEAGSGEYEMTTASSWPTDGYVFNETLSKCENGGELSWDDTNKTVVMKTSVTDKCYVYFDVVVITLSEYVIAQYTGTQGENNIYYHDGNLENGISDGSYRYSGASPNNYVCFGSNETTCPKENLYRIIGVIDGKVKLIKADCATSDLLGTDGDYNSGTKYYWNKNAATNGGKNTWSYSLLNTVNLNTNFITNIGETWANKIATTTWKVGGNTYAIIRNVIPSVAYQNEIVNPVTTKTTDNATEYTAKIGLMYVSDYGYAASSSAWTTILDEYYDSTLVNWMFIDLAEWTISRNADNSMSVFGVDDGGGGAEYLVSGTIYVRPVFFLNLDVTYISGDGSQSSPIRLG